MTMPVDIVTITVTGTYLTAGGAAAGGSVMFTPTWALSDATGHAILTGLPVTANLVNGSFSVALPVTDNANLFPHGWAYTVQVSVPGSSQVFTTYIPSSYGTTVDMTALTPAGTVTLPTTYVASVNGQSGNVTVTAINGVTVTNTPITGQTLKATSATTASWQ